MPVVLVWWCGGGADGSGVGDVVWCGVVTVLMVVLLWCWCSGVVWWRC